MVRKHGDRGMNHETAAHVLEVLRSSANDDGRVSMPLTEIASTLDVGVTAASKAVRWLLEVKLLRIERGYSRGTARIYKVVGMEKISKTTMPRQDWYRLAKEGKVYHRRVDMDSRRPARKRSKLARAA